MWTRTKLDQNRIAAISAVVDTARDVFSVGNTRPLESRIGRLKALRALITENRSGLSAALWEDLHKSRQESEVTELDVVLGEINHALRHLRRWSKARRAPLPLALLPGTARLLSEPLGVVLVIAPWNYPVQLLLAPLAGILGAGNSAVLKPSELAPATSRLIAQLIRRYFPDGAVGVIEGGERETTAVLAKQFDHILFTGSGNVGKVVLRAAAEHLTPVTLELGGKSPVWFDDDAHIHEAARRIVWAKFTNAGQTCVAPDYVLTTPERVRPLVAAMRIVIEDLWGRDPRQSRQYGRIISDRHFDRLVSLLDGADVAVGGRHTRDERYFAPTVVTVPEGADPTIGSGASIPALRDEIFGPILPIVAVDSAEEAVRRIAAFDKPLALYVFSANAETRRAFERGTSSGTILHDAAVVHVAAHGLPFGGVGASGMGAYHGRFSWNTFSHLKPIMRKGLWPETLRFIQPTSRGAARRLAHTLIRRG